MPLCCIFATQSHVVLYVCCRDISSAPPQRGQYFQKVGTPSRCNSMDMPSLQSGHGPVSA